MTKRNQGRKNSLLQTGGLFTCGILLVGALIWLMASCGDKGSRLYLDKFVETLDMNIAKSKALKGSTAVYVDFSDGMNSAYGTPLSQEALKSVVNSLTGIKGQASFFSLSNDTISPLSLTQTGIYNAIMSPSNYTQTMAPIEKTLARIIAEREPALLITDFEEYHGGLIQRQNYAKDYFIEWLSEGYDIIFYKLDYKEGALPKHLYFAVFDAPGGELAQEVEKSLGKYLSEGMEKFVLGGKCFQLYGANSYLSSTQGGNYHSDKDGDYKGADIVTAVLEDGGPEAFKSYIVSLFSPYAEYYPLGIEWEKIPENIKFTQEDGVPEGDRYTHFLSGFYVDFDKQNAYRIEQVAAVVNDIEGLMQRVIVVADSLEGEGKEFEIPTDAPAGKPVKDFFVASMKPATIDNLPGHNWKEIMVDFDSRFNGSLPAGMDAETDLIEIDVVIAKAIPDTARIQEFFSWPGNTALSESVLNAVLSKEVNPEGRAIITYFVKVS